MRRCDMVDSLDTSVLEVVALFGAGSRAAHAYKRWGSSNRTVADAVMEHTTRVPYQLNLEAVKDACARTGHALGQVRASDVNPVRKIADWTSPFATTHVLHFALESLGGLFI